MTDYLDMGLWPDRLRADEEFRDDHLFSLDAMVGSAAGPHYSRKTLGSYMPENHYHAYTSLMVPRLMHDNPRVRCTTRRPGSQMETAEAIRHGLNRWVRDVNLRNVGQQLAMDYCYTWGAAMVRQIPNRHMGKTTEKWIWGKDGAVRTEQTSSLWPSVYRIPQPQFILDSGALTPHQAEYMGHKWFATPDKVLAEAKRGGDDGWDVEALGELVGSAGSDGGSASTSDPERQDRARDPKKLELEFATVWVAELQLKESDGPDAGYHGTLMTLARAQGRGPRGAWRTVKKPVPYYGPPSGPYEIFGAYYLPNKLYPLSALVAVEGQIRELNRQARALSRSAEKHKRVVLYDYRDQATAARLKRAQHDFFVGIPGFDKAKFAEAELGGATDSQYKATAYLMDRLQRISAMDEAQQGNVTGMGTATEHSIANEAAATRLGYLRQQFSSGMSGVLMKAAWWLYHDSQVIFPLGEEAADDFEMMDPWFHGGMDDEDASFDDLELEIEAYSMQRTDQESLAARTQAGLTWIIETAMMRPQTPWVDWEKIDDLAAQVYDLPDLAGLVDNEAALMAGQFQDGGQEQQPRLSMDVGSQKSYSSSFSGGAKRAAPTGPQAQAQGLPGGNNGVQMIGQGAA